MREQVAERNYINDPIREEISDLLVQPHLPVEHKENIYLFELHSGTSNFGKQLSARFSDSK
jgi:hypothetical protein